MCDTLCHVGRHRTTFAKSSDRPLGEPQVVEVHAARPAGGRLRTQYVELDDAGACVVLGSRPTWLWGFEHGVNEHGVAIGNERVWTDDDPDDAPDALIGMDLVRLGLERARSADEAVAVMTDLLATHGQGGIADATAGEAYWSSFLIADGHGAVVLETSGTDWATEPVPAGAGRSISNRLSIPTFVDRHLPTDLETGFADVRAAVTGRAADVGATGEALRRVLRDHGGADDGSPVQPLPDRRADFDGTGVSVCMHIRGFEATAASMVVELDRDGGPGPALCALGSPCVSCYVPVFLDAGAPPLLSDPDTWATFDAARAAVERVTDEVDADLGLRLATSLRAALDPMERALVVEAAEAAAGGPEARRRFRADAEAALASTVSAVRSIVATVPQG